MGGLTAPGAGLSAHCKRPRERGKYSGYMGAVMAVGTAGGPLLGGFIVDSALGWRWTFFVCVPLAVVALILLQVTLKIPHVRRPAKIDWVGSILLTSGVSLLLIWVSFAGKADYYDWWAWESAVMVGGGVLLLALLVLVESKVSQPIIPLKIISEAHHRPCNRCVRGGWRGNVRFLHVPWPVLPGGPRRHAHRGRPADAAHDCGQPHGLGGVRPAHQPLRQVEELPRGGTILLTGALPSPEPSTTPLNCGSPGCYTAIFGLGLGLLMQNLVLAVQNTVRAKDIGSASASVAFFAPSAVRSACRSSVPSWPPRRTWPPRPRCGDPGQR